MITGNVIEIATMAIKENAKDLQSQKYKAMDIIVFIKYNLIPYVDVVGTKEC